MREILFRGKRITNDEWLEGDFTKTKGNAFIMNNGSGYPVLSSTVGQFTGLFDKNGTKIFEGDILQCVVEPKPKGIVRFGEYQTPYRDWSPVCDYYSKHIGFFIEWENNFRKDLAFWGKTVEVIGNIYDNPELVKAGD